MKRPLLRTPAKCELHPIPLLKMLPRFGMMKTAMLYLSLGLKNWKFGCFWDITSTHRLPSDKSLLLKWCSCRWKDSFSRKSYFWKCGQPKGLFFARVITVEKSHDSQERTGIKKGQTPSVSPLLTFINSMVCFKGLKCLFLFPFGVFLSQSIISVLNGAEYSYFDCLPPLNFDTSLNSPSKLWLSKTVGLSLLASEHWYTSVWIQTDYSWEVNQSEEVNQTLEMMYCNTLWLGRFAKPLCESELNQKKMSNFCHSPP